MNSRMIGDTFLGRQSFLVNLEAKKRVTQQLYRVMILIRTNIIIII